MSTIAAIATDPAQRNSAIALTWTFVVLAMAILLWPRGKGRRLSRQIFAVAVLGFREGLRMKVLWTVAALALIPGFLAYFSDADGTHAGRAALILNYCLSTGELLGAMLIVLLSALSVSHEIESRIMHTFGTKPVPRWSILLGKTLGFWAIDLCFLLGLLLFTSILVRCVPLRPEARTTSKLVSTGTWDDLRRNALTTREYESPLGSESGGGMKMIKPGGMHTWRFDVDPRNMDDAIALRFQLSSTYTFASHIEDLGVTIGYEGPTKPFYDQTLRVPQDRPFQLFIDRKDVSGAGTLAVTLTASAKGKHPPSIVGSVKMGIPTDGLSQNLLKAGVLMALQGWILAMITCSWSGVLSFPVTVAMGLILILGGEMSRHALELLQVGAARAKELSLAGSGQIQQDVGDQLRFLLGLLPDFQAAGGPTVFVDGNHLSGWAVAEAILMMGIVRGIGWALPGIYLFHRREVGR